MSTFNEIGKIEVPKSWDLLAARLRERILRGEFPDNTSLPTERALMGTTGLSRSAVREALRILEAEGLVQTRPGRYGGTIVCRPSDKLFARNISIFAKGRGITVEAMLEAREGIEPLLAELAAKNRTDADLDALRAVTARLKAATSDDQQFLRANVDWHMALAAASHNSLLSAFMGSISELIHDATRHEEFTTETVRELVIHAHDRILEAVAAKDPVAARRRMQRHVCSYSERMDVLISDQAELSVAAS